MNKPRFQMPPRGNKAVDGWETVLSAEMRPPMTFAGLLAAQGRNIAAIAAANRVILEATQAVARRNIEIMQQAIDGFSARMRTIGNPECPADRAIRQTETAIRAYEDTTANMRELADMIWHANTEAMEVLHQRFTEAADEAKSLARSTVRNFWEIDAKPVPL